MIRSKIIYGLLVSVTCVISLSGAHENYVQVENVPCIDSVDTDQGGARVIWRTAEERIAFSREFQEELNDILDIHNRVGIRTELTAEENEYFFKELGYHPPRLIRALTNSEADTLRMFHRLEAQRMINESYESIMRDVQQMTTAHPESSTQPPPA